MSHVYRGDDAWCHRFRKTSYPSLDVALDVLRAIRADPRTGQVPSHVHECLPRERGGCGGWHLTSHPGPDAIAP